MATDRAIGSDVSWDVFVQDIPQSASRPQDIPDDSQPTPLQLDRASVVRIANALDIGTINDSEPAWVRWEGPGFDIELNMPSDPVDHFAMHCRGDVDACRQAATSLVKALDVRAFAVEDGVIIG